MAMARFFFLPAYKQAALLWRSLRFPAWLTTMPFLTLTPPAHAWFANGHALIADIAQQNLTDTTRSEIDKLLQVKITSPGTTSLSEKTSSMVLAATWLDSIRFYLPANDTKIFPSPECHYVAILLSPEDVKKGSTNKKSLSAEDFLPRVHTFLKKREGQHNSFYCLNSMISTLRNPQAPEIARAIALRGIIHITGDIGQPLHNAFYDDGKHGGDNGGNQSIPNEEVFKKFKDKQTQKLQNLHLLWDASLNEFPVEYWDNDNEKNGDFSENWQESIHQYATMLNSSSPEKTAVLQDFHKQPADVAFWIADAAALSARYVYGDLIIHYQKEQTSEQMPIYNVSFKDGWENYRKQSSPVVRHQVLLSGLRLSAILNAIFDPKVADSRFVKMVSEAKDAISSK